MYIFTLLYCGFLVVECRYEIINFSFQQLFLIMYKNKRREKTQNEFGFVNYAPKHQMNRKILWNKTFKNYVLNPHFVNPS